MTQRHMFVVSDDGTVPAEAVSLSDLHLTEVRDLEEWVIEHPEVLGPDVKVVATQFDRWQTEGGSRARERLDVLGLENTGRLVVAGLKRDTDAGIHVQAITYAALVSGFTEETLAHAHADFLTRRGAPTTAEEALDMLREDLEADFDPDILSNPRIVLMARAFPAQVVTTAEWLSNRNVDISLVQVQAWRVADRVAVTFDQVYPLPGLEDALLIPARRRVAKEQEAVAETTRAAAASKVILNQGLLDDGSVLTLRPATTTSELREAASTWAAESPERGRAIWRTDGGKPMEWEWDGQRYSPSGLVRRILKEAAGEQPAVHGTKWWVTDDGTDLTEIAYGTGRRDWSDLHDLIARVQPGQWTTYGDLGRAIGLPAQPVGTHIANCPDCPYGAHRVLTADGRPSDSFRWSDPKDLRTAREVLEGEGLKFDALGRANADARVDEDGLRGRQSVAHAAISEEDS